MQTAEMDTTTAREAEDALIGALVVDRDAIIKVAPVLGPADFWFEPNRLTYSAILTLYTRREPPDVHTLAVELQRRGHLDRVGGLAALAGWMARVHTAVHAPYYAAAVRRASLGRATVAAGYSLMQLGLDEHRSPEALIEQAHSLIAGLTSGTPDPWIALQDAAGGVIDDLGVRRSAPGAAGIPSGFPSLDALTYGWEAGDLVILGASTSRGKTTLGLTFALAAAARGLAVAVVSLEMSRHKLARRFLAMTSRVPMDRLRSARLTDRDFDDLTEAAAAMPARLYLLDSTTVTLATLAAQAQALQADPARGLDLLVVDYIQLMSTGQHRPGERQAEVAAISRGLKVLAETLRIPIIALSQFNRASEKHENPQLSDLRESGALEMDASIVLALNLPDEKTRWRVDLHVLKNRDGVAGDAIALMWNGATQQFVELIDAGPVWAVSA